MTCEFRDSADADVGNRTLTANIRQRRGSLVDIRVPLFIDTHTELPDGMKEAPKSNGNASEFIMRMRCVFTEMFRSRQADRRNTLHPHGRNGFRHGLLLPSDHFPGVERGRGEKGV